MLKKGMVIVLSGPSGSGKDTIIKNILKKMDKISSSISATTRNPRAGEKNGKDYYFLSEQEFEYKINSGQMLEYAIYCGNYYGTPYEPLIKKTNKGLDVILNVETIGSRLIRENLPESVHIFLLPPSFKELELRLKNRGTESEKLINERLRIAKEEIDYFESYDYILVNENIEVCTKQVSSIIISEKLKINRIKDRSEAIIKEMF